MKKFKYNNSELSDEKIKICAIINVTPDSFSDGNITQ